MKGGAAISIAIVLAAAVGVYFYTQLKPVASSTGADPIAEVAPLPSEQAAANASPIASSGSTSGVGADQQSYETATDLFALVEGLKGRSANGDGTATRLIAKAYEECWTYARDPAGFQKNRDVALGIASAQESAIAQSFDKISERCRRFAGDDIGPRHMLDVLTLGAEQKDLASEVELFALLSRQHRSDNETFGVAKQQDLLNRVVASRDPASIAAMANLMGPGALGKAEQLKPFPAGTVRAEAAWRIAACRLGAPCGASSSALSSACAFGGICGFSSVESLYLDGLLPKSERDLLNRDIQTIMEGVNNETTGDR